MTWKHEVRTAIYGCIFALSLGMVILALSGDNPMLLVEALSTSLFTGFGLGYTLFYSTPLIFTGLSVAVCFRCGLFNIGAEGQLYAGALGILLSSLLFPNAPGIIAIPLGLLAGALFGALWGGIAGVLKAKRGSHEVIVTILLNFVSMYLVNYLILYPLDDPNTQKPESLPLGAGYAMPLLSDFGLGSFENTPVNLALFIGIATAFAIRYLLFSTPLGFEMRSVGYSPHASRVAGISVSRQTIFAFLLSGALAGMVGLNDVLGYHHRIVEGFSPGYGAAGIAVALLARNNPIGILFAAFLFGTLHNGARELEFLSERVTKELAYVIQAVLIAAVAAPALGSTIVGVFKKVKTPGNFKMVPRSVA